MIEVGAPATGFGFAGRCHQRASISLSEEHRPAIDAWLARGAEAWRIALEPLTDAERALFVRTLKAYEDAV